ncbi:GGDEF domain-containing protein [Anaerovorax odorimutans]|uniref:GGDEF domain-containing protein n=1 Tax=Anaerovorax odorimutans TaxID=109327 RepID=UPI00040DC095|nr:GGDEF domain-containing protein [Anaerovorax odorimutans]
MFLFYNKIPKKSKIEFYNKKFMHNNLSILILSIYLAFEQLYYGIFLREPGSLIQLMHIISALLSIIYGIVACYIQIKKVKKISYLLKFYEISFGFCGFIIAIVRALYVNNNAFLLPTFYIAVLYAFAVIFYFHPLKSFCIYSITSIIVIILLPIFHPDVIEYTYIADILSNNILAWIVSFVSYERYVKEYISQSIIFKKNQLLKEKTSAINKINKKLHYNAIMDSLTNIYNRRKLDELLEFEHIRSIESNLVYSLILLDIDMFKTINDTYGHNIGDKVLSETGKVLKNNIPRNYKVGRWGGDEFLIICPETDKDKAMYTAEIVRRKIENANYNLDIVITGSFGVASFEKTDTVLNLINKVDKGLYKAKNNGRNRVEKF